MMVMVIETWLEQSEFNATTAQNSLNASGIASGLFYGAKFENATINVNFSS